MKFKVITILIFLFVGSELLLLSQINNSFNTKKEMILDNHQQTKTNEFNIIVNILRDLSKNTFKGFINKPEVLEAVAKKQRKKLYDLLKKDYQYLKKLGFMQVHFHLPDSTSFLRMHQPHRYGDNLKDARYSVNYANRYKTFVEGLEAGRVVPGYRFVYPLFFKQQHIGSVELSFTVNKIVTEIENVYKTHTHYLIDKKVFSNKVLKEFQSFYMPSIEHPNYVKLNRSYINKLEPWYEQKHYQEIVETGLQTKEPFNFELEVYSDDQNLHIHKLVSFLPIMNIEKTTPSYFVFYSDSQTLLKLEKEQLFTTIIGSLTLSLIFTLLYLFYQHRETIVNTRDRLQQFNSSLEEKVQEKTKQLHELNSKLIDVNKNLETKIEQEVAKSREKDLQLFIQSKKASMGEMVGAIAHQWRQPLNELSIRIQKLHYDYAQEKIDQKFIEDFIQANKNTINFMSRTIDGFRAFFRIEKEKTQYDVKGSIQEVLLMLDAQLEHFKIKTQISGTNFTHYSYKTEFQQVVLNMINNAKDVLVENNIATPTITITLQNNHITISDNGDGVPADIEYKIFDPYFTTKDEGKGTGMGLYISKLIIEDNMKGELYLENSKDGASFHIKL